MIAAVAVAAAAVWDCYCESCWAVFVVARIGRHDGRIGGEFVEQNACGYS